MCSVICSMYVRGWKQPPSCLPCVSTRGASLSRGGAIGIFGGAFFVIWQGPSCYRRFSILPSCPLNASHTPHHSFKCPSPKKFSNSWKDSKPPVEEHIPHTTLFSSPGGAVISFINELGCRNFVQPFSFSLSDLSAFILLCSVLSGKFHERPEAVPQSLLLRQ